MFLDFGIPLCNYGCASDNMSGVFMAEGGGGGIDCLDGGRLQR
jgi:hypothetical protein